MVLVATMAASGWSTAPIAGAAARSVDEEHLAVVDDVHTLADVAELGRRPESDGDVRLAVLSDTNGTQPGGLDVTAVSAPSDRVDQLTEALDAVPGVLSTETDSRVSLAEDPYASQQYATRKVRANLVRSLADGAGVIVAVIDTGVQASHADLSGELGSGATRVLTGTTFLTPDGDEPDLTGTPGTSDPNGHGTHVAGIIAAHRNNGIGVEGIAPEAQILPVRALDRSGFGWASDVAEAILWAHGQGADVINLSLAGPTRSTAVSAAITSVSTDTSRGTAPTIVVAAAGNSARAYSKMWPAAGPRVIAVASSDGNDEVADTSSRGTYVDVAAPGVNILSTCAPAGYCYRSGTSMASPLVAGAAALLRQQDPSRGVTQVEGILEDSAFDIDLLGRDDASGWGRVDVAAALDPANHPTPPRPAHLPTGSVDAVTANGRFVTVVGRAHDPENTPIVRVVSTVDGRRSQYDVWAIGGAWGVGWNAEPGTHRICVSVLDTPTRQPVSLGCTELVVK